MLRMVGRKIKAHCERLKGTQWSWFGTKNDDNLASSHTTPLSPHTVPSFLGICNDEPGCAASLARLAKTGTALS